MLSRFFIQQPFGSTWLFYDTKDIATTGLPSRPFRWFIMHARSCCSYVMIREAKCKVHRRWLLGTMNHEAYEAMKPNQVWLSPLAGFGGDGLMGGCRVAWLQVLGPTAMLPSCPWISRKPSSTWICRPFAMTSTKTGNRRLDPQKTCYV